MAELSEGELRALRHEMGLDKMGGQHANTVVDQIIDGEVDPEEMRQTAEEAEQAEQEGQKVAQEEGDAAREESLQKQTQRRQEESAAKSDSGDSNNLEDMSKAELLEEAERRGVDANQSNTKQEIIDSINAG